jgi:hypothetical protein
MRSIALATEDELSEAVGYRLIAEWKGALEVGLPLRRGGNGYLRSRMRNSGEIFRQMPVLIITDLDQRPCSSVLRSEWLASTPTFGDLLLRVAVREVESWLMADTDAMRALLGRRATAQLPSNPESIANPKEFLLHLASSGPRDVRRDLCPSPGSVARQGLGYNARLCRFVADVWNPERAASRSDSLRRARGRIEQLASR